MGQTQSKNRYSWQEGGYGNPGEVNTKTTEVGGFEGKGLVTIVRRDR